MPRYDVFLSHASADKPAVEHLAHKLREVGIEPFLDKWHLVPGERWIIGLDDALAHSDSFAVFFGARSGGGVWRTREVELALERTARQKSFRVIPVLLPGGNESALEELSTFLGLHTWVDLRAGLDDEDAFHRLLAGIRGGVPGPGSGGGGGKPLLPYRCMAPAREPFVQRSEYAKVRDALLVDDAGGTGRATTVGITTAIHGAGGFGKTALAIELCYDEKVRERYPDGTLWVQMRDTLDDDGRLKEIRDVLRRWTREEPPAFETVAKAGQHLIELLNGKQVLLVIDDVWRPEDVTPFQGLVALLVTTRDSRTLPVDSVPVHVDALEISEAVRLLGSGLPDGTGVDLRGMATRLGEWPLLLKIVNRQLRELIQQDGLSLEQSLQEVNEALDAEGLTVFDREDLESRGQAVVRTIGASLRRLSGEEVGRFVQLAIFPEDKDISLLVLEKLWGLGSFATKKLCGRLHDLSLLLRFDRPASTTRLHDVIRAYLLKKGESHLAEWHRHLLNAYRPANGRWSDLPREESYLWNHLVHHLTGAGQSEICRDLLLDFDYLRSKLGATDVNALLGDYSSFAEKNEELRLVRDALRLSAHVLARNPAELRGQLWGRLLGRPEAGVRSLLQASEGSGAPWLRPRKASLNRPGGALIRIIDHPGNLSALAVLPDGRLVSGSSDGKVRVWDVESGQTLKILEGHSNGRAVAVLDNRRVVSGSSDGKLRVWDVESGQALQILEGHSDSVLAVGVLDSRRVVSGSSDGTLRVWDVESGQALQVLEGHSSWVRAAAVLDSRRVVSGSRDGTLRVWDVESGQALQILRGHSNEVNAVAVLDSRRVVSGSDDRTLRVWDVESGQALQVLEGHSSRVGAVAVLDSRWVVSGSRDRTLRVWDVEKGEAIAVLEGHSAGVRSVAILTNRRLISGSIDKTLRVWDVDIGRALDLNEGQPAGVSSLAILDEQRVVSGSDDGLLQVWDIDSGQSLAILKHTAGISALAVLEKQVVSGCFDGRLLLWDVDSGELLAILKAPGSAGFNIGVGAVVGLLGGSGMISGYDDGMLRVWGGKSASLEGHSNRIRALAAIDIRRVVSASDDATLRVWDVVRRQAVAILADGSCGIHAVAVLDKNLLFSGSADGTMRVWNIGNGRAFRFPERHTAEVRAVTVLDHRYVASGSEDQTLRVWDLRNGKVECLFTLDAPVTAVTAIPGSRTLVAGDSSGQVHFFDFVEP